MSLHPIFSSTVREYLSDRLTGSIWFGGDGGNGECILVRGTSNNGWVFQHWILLSCYMVICWRLMTELLSPMVVMSEGLGFNLCAAPFLYVCVPNLPQRSRTENVGGGWNWVRFN